MVIDRRPSFPGSRANLMVIKAVPGEKVDFVVLGVGYTNVLDRRSGGISRNNVLVASAKDEGTKGTLLSSSGLPLPELNVNNSRAEVYDQGKKIADVEFRPS